MSSIVEEARKGWRTEIEPRPLDPRAPLRRAVELAAAVAGATVFFDVVITWAAIRHGLAWEQNPVVAPVMDRVGVTPTLLFGAVVRAAIVAGLAFLAVRATRRVVRVSAALVLGGVAVWWTAVVFANAVVLGRHV